MFERFTDHARRVVVAAQDEARLLGHEHIGSEHLLLGLLSVQGSMATHVLKAAGLTAEAARVKVGELTGRGSTSPREHIPFTPRAKKILELSLRESLAQKKRHIGTEHVLLALMHNADGLGAQVLERLAGPLPALRQQVLETASAATPDTVPEATEVAEGKDSPEAEARTWQLAREYGREVGIRPHSIAGFRGLLTLIDRRLTAIEHHLGITAGGEAAGGEAASGEAAAGFRRLITSVDRHLTNIEHHLGVTVGEGTGEADEPPAGR